MLKMISRQPALMSRLALFVLISSCVCFAVSGPHKKLATGGGEDPTSPAFNGLSFKVQNSTTPPGGLFQFQLMLTEPKPIGHGSTRPTVPSGPVRGIALDDPTGLTVGVAVVNESGIQVNFNSPGGSFGTNPDLDSPILTIAFPIAESATVGQHFPLGIDIPDSLWIDPSGQPYPQEVANGTLTIGGTLTIRDVVPGGGLQPAGAKISILGMGFTPDTRVHIESIDLNRRAVQFISPTQLDVVLPSALQMDGARVQARTQTERSTYFSYFRAHPVGESTHALVAQSYPLFARQTFTSATLPWLRSGQQFTALALQNPGADAVSVMVEMQSATGETLGTVSLPLPGSSKITRDLTELFANPPAGAVAVRVTPSQPIQILGLLGDDATSNVVPVMVSTP